MDIIQAIILGAVQGLTEFLPVSSSAHLVLVPAIMHVTSSVAFDVILHLGSLIAVIIYFWRDLVSIVKNFFLSLVDLVSGRFKEGLKENPFKKLAWLIIVGSIPAAIFGFLFKSQLESVFENIPAVGFFLIITGLLLWSAERVKRGNKNVECFTFKNSLVIGLFQAFAILPGISRSGATISAGLFSGLNRELAARYSFLLSIPAILGSTLVTAKEITGLYNTEALLLIAGFLSAAIFGYIAIKLLLKIIKERTLMIFAYYCWTVGIITLILSYWYKILI
ncbi:MAG: undecaprenyl-diphosphatase UppP, partial [Methanobacterium sp.]